MTHGEKKKLFPPKGPLAARKKIRFQGLAYINLAKWNHISHIFHQPRFRRNSRGFPFQNATFWGENACEVALIWPNQYILAIFVWKNVDLWYCRYWHSVVAQLAMRVCGHPKPPHKRKIHSHTSKHHFANRTKLLKIWHAALSLY